ncbi:MAG TPA: rhodanese-like domain-containing protein [Spirochaetota bacterium]|nr:rhodanese-like domain-containing protein [Spirochaetota bacterium]HOL56325.1 rhodanese-like domain-containing protein [Spirochaetota bacterium]HPP03558.1 rhodanese-like domain-containing protein [Spirochaetota bacterium]
MKRALFLLILITLSSMKCDKEYKENKNLENNQTIITISVDDFYRLVSENKKNKDVVIIDFRTQEEYKGGHLENAININFYDNNLKDILNNLEKDKIYLIYCRSGNRSRKALKIMEELNFKQVYNMEGGIIQWNIKGYPLISEK